MAYGLRDASPDAGPPLHGSLPVALSWQGTPENTEPHKCGGVTFAPIESLPAPFLQYVGEAIAAIRANPQETVYVERVV